MVPNMNRNNRIRVKLRKLESKLEFSGFLNFRLIVQEGVTDKEKLSSGTMISQLVPAFEL